MRRRRASFPFAGSFFFRGTADAAVARRNQFRASLRERSGSRDRAHRGRGARLRRSISRARTSRRRPAATARSPTPRAAISARRWWRGSTTAAACSACRAGCASTASRTPDAGAELLFEGRSVGRATSVTRSPRFGAIGLGLLHQRGAAAGNPARSRRRRRGRGRGAPFGERRLDQTANDEPQPQVPVARGLLNLNPAPFMPKT